MLCTDSAFSVQPFVAARPRLLWPRLTSGSPERQRAGSPRVRRVAFVPYTRRIYRRPVRMTIGLQVFMPPRPPADGLLCGSCSSGRDFAYSFLQTPPRGERPCCSAKSSGHYGLQGTYTPKPLPGSVSLPVETNTAYQPCRFAPCLAHTKNTATGAAVQLENVLKKCGSGEFDVLLLPYLADGAVWDMTRIGPVIRDRVPICWG